MPPTLDDLPRFFPLLRPEQTLQFREMIPLYQEWNARINVVSRKDIDNLFHHHILHSLSIARYLAFENGCSVLDAGTGGGFPGIPLAVMFPEVTFTLADSIGKKIRVVQEIASALGLHNVHPVQCRLEELNTSFDFIVSRAVMRLDTFWEIVSGHIQHTSRHTMPNGILYLKGGDFSDELQLIRGHHRILPLFQLWGEDLFPEKALVHLFH